MNDKPRPGYVYDPERKRRMSKTEAHLESPQYKRERLRDLTGIEDEQQLFDIYYDLQQLFIEIGFARLTYRRNTVDARANTETELALLNLTGDEFVRAEQLLKELRIFGFPEPVSGSNHTSLIIENRRDLEVLRLMSVFKDLDTRREAEERQKRDEAAELARRQQIEQEAKEYADRVRAQAEERLAELGAQARAQAERSLREAAERAEQQRTLELEQKWEEEKRAFAEKRQAERKRLEEIVSQLLAQIEPQVIELDFQVAELKEPLKEVTKFRGFQEKVPKDRKRVGDAQPELLEMQDLLGEFDAVSVDEWAERYETLWKDGTLVDLEHEPLRLPGGHVNLSLFPKHFVWKASKGTKRKKCYEYDPKTRQVGKEVTKEDRQAYMMRLGELRRQRHAQEARLNTGKPEEQHVALPKSKEETELEQKVVLLTNNLIVWLINDLTSGLRGNIELRKIKVNDADELYQSAIIALLYVVDHFDPAREDANLTAYLMSRMEGAIRQFHSGEHGYAGQKEQVRVPLGLIDLRRKFQRVERLLRSQFPAESDQHLMQLRLVKALAQPDIGMLREDSTLEDLRNLRKRLMLDYAEIPASALEGTDENPDTELGKIAELINTPADQHERAERMQLKQAVSQILATLTPREERIIRLRFFPQGVDETDPYLSTHDQPDGMTLHEIADHFGITDNRVMQIEHKALRKLKHPSRTRKVAAYKPPPPPPPRY